MLHPMQVASMKHAAKRHRFQGHRQYFAYLIHFAYSMKGASIAVYSQADWEKKQTIDFMHKPAILKHNFGFAGHFQCTFDCCSVEIVLADVTNVWQGPARQSVLNMRWEGWSTIGMVQKCATVTRATPSARVCFLGALHATCDSSHILT